jgi:hypothetical protein
MAERCRIGTGHQNEWYFFSHKDKKYPTGTRTNRATTAGFWKATGRDKAIFLGNASRRIGLRKTLVFYIGRAPHGKKTDWIMHEYRLDQENVEIQVIIKGPLYILVFLASDRAAIMQSDSNPDMVYRKMVGWCVGFSRRRAITREASIRLKWPPHWTTTSSSLSLFLSPAAPCSQQSTRPTLLTSCNMTILPSTLPCSSHS